MGMPVAFASCSRVKLTSFRRALIKSPSVPVGKSFSCRATAAFMGKMT